MGKYSQIYVESDDTDTSSSVENFKKKKLNFLSKFSNGNLKKKKVKVYKSEPDGLCVKSKARSNPKLKQKLRGILKYDKSREASDDEEVEAPKLMTAYERCLVGHVPRPPGSKPCRGGGLALIIKKDVPVIHTKCSHSGTKRRDRKIRLQSKLSY